jgi:hypothetical protein
MAGRGRTLPVTPVTPTWAGIVGVPNVLPVTARDKASCVSYPARDRVRGG